MSILISVIASMIISHVYIRMMLEEDLTETFTEVDQALKSLEIRVDEQQVYLNNLEGKIRKVSDVTKRDLDQISEKVDQMNDILIKVLQTLED